MVNLPEQRIFHLQGRNIILAYSGYRLYVHVIDHYGKLHGYIDHFYLQITESISSRKTQLCRQDVHMYILFLNPAFTDPAVIFCRICSQLLNPFRKSQINICRCILMTACTGQSQSYISDLMITKIKNNLIISFKLLFIKHLEILRSYQFLMESGF